MLADPALEARAREVSRELRCLVCRNQSIDDSDADLAHDLRVLVRERIKAGDSNEQTIGFVRARYGDFVLLRPPFAIGTALLWGGPLLVLLLGGCRGRAALPRGATSRPPPLSAEERQRLSAVLAKKKARDEPRPRHRADRADLAGLGDPARAAACCAGIPRPRARATTWRSIATSSPKSSAMPHAGC